MIGLQRGSRLLLGLLAVLLAVFAVWLLWLPPSGGVAPLELTERAEVAPVARPPSASVSPSSVPARGKTAPKEAVARAEEERKEPHRCAIPEGYTAGNAELFTLVRGGKLELKVPVPIRVVSGDLVFSPRASATQGTVQQGREPIHTLSWSGEGRDTVCRISSPPAPWTLSVTVDDPVESGAVTVRGCGIQATYRGDPLEAERSSGSTCEVVATRRDGALTVRSDRVEVSGDDGEHVEVVLVLPREDAGGLGAEVRSVSSGLELSSVGAGSAAARAGLEPGDVVLAVGDVSLAGLAQAAQVDLVTGPIGETIQLRVLRGDEERVVDVRRAWVEELREPNDR